MGVLGADSCTITSLSETEGEQIICTVNVQLLKFSAKDLEDFWL
jgi:hypothetical protein